MRASGSLGWTLDPRTSVLLRERQRWIWEREGGHVKTEVGGEGTRGATTGWPRQGRVLSGRAGPGDDRISDPWPPRWCDSTVLLL